MFPYIETESSYICLHKQIFARGKCVYNCPPLCDSVNFANVEFGRFWDEYKRLANPHVYKVDLSDGLYELKQELLKKRGGHGL